MLPKTVGTNRDLVVVILVIKIYRTQGSPPRVRLGSSHGAFADFFSPDANRFVHIRNEDFPIPDFSRLGRRDDRFDRCVNAFLGQDQFEFQFGQEIHRVFAATVDFGVPLLPPKPFHLGDRHSVNPDVAESILHFVQLERLDDRFDFLHKFCAV